MGPTPEVLSIWTSSLICQLKLAESTKQVLCSDLLQLEVGVLGAYQEDLSLGRMRMVMIGYADYQVIHFNELIILLIVAAV